MNRFLAGLALALFSLCAAPAFAQPASYTSTDGTRTYPVTPAAPMPVSVHASGAAVDMVSPVQTYASNSFLNVAAGTATTVVKSGAGALMSITINTKGASSNTLTCYDNTAASGTVIGIIDTTSNVGTLAYNATLGTGLTCISATGTGANYTVTYR